MLFTIPISLFTGDLDLGGGVLGGEARNLESCGVVSIMGLKDGRPRSLPVVGDGRVLS